MSERPERQHDQPRRPGPRFTVIVPTFDRPGPLAACVRALRALERPGGTLEIVIVNDGGRPPSAEVVRGAETGLEIRVIEQRNAGPASARNAGAAAARGEWLAFTDDDCLPDTAWLSAFDAALRATPDALAGGRTVNAFPDSVFADTSQRLADFVSSYFDGGATGRFFTSNNIAVSRQGFLDAGGFDARFPFSAGEDRELCDRWSAQGRPSVTVKEAVVGHAHRLSARRFLRQHFTYGRGAVAFRRVRAESGRPVRIDLSFYVRSLSFALHGGEMGRGVVRAMLTALAHAAYAAGLLWESRRRARRAPAR
ncbi:MAG TPA: glycosyltransferase [Gemmatimonadaceae bacterium]|nr:glycosyltransferase [Gemmatimonadaceae bacterium]